MPSERSSRGELGDGVDDLASAVPSLMLGPCGDGSSREGRLQASRCPVEARMAFILSGPLSSARAEWWQQIRRQPTFLESELVCQRRAEHSPHSPGQWTQEPTGEALSLLRRRLRLAGKVKARPKATSTWQVMDTSEHVLDEC